MVAIEQINYIKSPSSKIYKTLTTQEGLSNIWTPKLKVKPEIGFVNEFDFDEGYLTKMKVQELRGNKWVLWECIDSDPEWVETKVSFELSENENVTTIVLKHFDWKEMTGFYRWCNYNWAMFLWRLKKYCEK
ncbi:ATPase [Marivirga lumbricoides]|uniref:ATPase n=1 Tax=Marivirga lumbricoides TaxID=1046115 RepID=A0A2T4DQY7_9BACT|nr:ATPase [Marivirga lumbricoides]